MDDRSRNFWVGVFMLGTLGALAALTVLFGERPSWLGGAEWELRISFTEVEGVSEGMEITMNGVQVGRVGSVEFINPELPQRGVQVIGLIKERYSIPKGTKAKVYAGPRGIGRGRIELVVETLDERMLPKENANISGEMGSPFEDLVPDSLMFTLEKTARQIGDLAAEGIESRSSGPSPPTRESYSWGRLTRPGLSRLRAAGDGDVDLPSARFRAIESLVWKG